MTISRVGDIPGDGLSVTPTWASEPPGGATPPTHAELREKLAAIEHQRWADWHNYMRRKGHKAGPDYNHTTPAEWMDRWDRQAVTPYADLTDAEKASDMEQVDRYWPLIAPLLVPPAEWEALTALEEAVEEALPWLPKMRETTALVIALDAIAAARASQQETRG